MLEFKWVFWGVRVKWKYRYPGMEWNSTYWFWMPFWWSQSITIVLTIVECMYHGLINSTIFLWFSKNNANIRCHELMVQYLHQQENRFKVHFSWIDLWTGFSPQRAPVKVRTIKIDSHSDRICYSPDVKESNFEPWTTFFYNIAFCCDMFRAWFEIK